MQRRPPLPWHHTSVVFPPPIRGWDRQQRYDAQLINILAKEMEMFDNYRKCPLVIPGGSSDDGGEPMSWPSDKIHLAEVQHAQFLKS